MSMTQLESWLSNNNCQISFRANKYDYEHYNRKLYSKSVELNQTEIITDEARFEVGYELSEINKKKGIVEVEVTFKCLEGRMEQASLSVDISFSKWSADNYLLMPGVVYNGNKFDVWKSPHWYPFVTDQRYYGKDHIPLIPDIPRLDKDGGVSRIQLRSGSMTSPSVGFQSPHSKKGIWLMTTQESQLGDFGIDVEENRNRTQVTMTITAPLVREVYRYYHMSNQFPSSDKAATLQQGDEVNFTFRLHAFDAPEIQDLFDVYSDIRKDLTVDQELAYSFPFSDALKVLENKYNRDNWNPEIGYYKCRPDHIVDWQMGWLGGGIFTYPLIMRGKQESKDRVSQMMDWLFENGISPSGYCWDSSVDGKKFHGIYPEIQVGRDCHLVRNAADSLYYLIRHLQAFKLQKMELKPHWESGIKGIAEALLKTWREEGQLGHYVHQENGEVVQGGTASGALVPAALILAARYFKETDYLDFAKEMAQFFYENFTKNGLTYGGPGDALHVPDSESAYSLVESFVALYEETKDQKWLGYAIDAANQFSTWVLSYNFRFPDSSYFGKLGIKSIGAVFANPQNTHAAPGICTFSGLALLKLYRATGEEKYARLLLDTAHNIPQYLSHPIQMVNPAHEGWMCERVNTVDWIQEIGEIQYLSTWPEAALAVTCIELPGIYVNKSTGFIANFDNIKARMDENGDLVLENPTQRSGEFTLLIDDTDSLKNPLGDFFLNTQRIVKIEAGQQVIVSI